MSISGGDSVDNHVNLIKLCVGVDDIEGLQRRRATQRAENPAWICRQVTRMWPKRADEVLNGGSLYWVFRGVILARQRILRLDEVIGEDGIRRCGIVMDEELIRTEAVPRRAFQGWRYLNSDDAPADLRTSHEGDTSLPPALQAALAEIGVR